VARKVTLGDVARAAGVSLATVDRVLNGRGGVDPGKEAAVLGWARRLGLDRNLGSRPTRLLRVGMLMSEASNPFYASLHEAVARANRAFEADGIRCFVHHLDVLSPQASAARIASAAAGHDALVVVCPEEPLIAAAVAAAASVLPVVTLASDLPRSGRLAYVGADNRAAGRVAGELMGKFLGRGGGEVVVVSGLHSYVGHEEREMGFRAVLRERFPACRLAAVVETRERGEAAGALVTRLFRRHPGIAGVYNVSTGDREIARALVRLDLGRHVTFVTHELTPERRALLREGVIDAVIDQNPDLEVATAVGLIARHFGRRDAAPTTGITPLTIYLRENS
jgi:LacI family transcriptional regulator